MAETMKERGAEDCVSGFLASWQARDIDHLMSFFGADSVYHNVPVEPISGLKGIREIFQAFLDLFSEASLDVIHMAAAGNVVLAERIDRFTMRDGRKIVLPVAGVFEVEGGKIKRFSDYFDLASFERQSGMKL